MKYHSPISFHFADEKVSYEVIQKLSHVQTKIYFFNILTDFFLKKSVTQFWQIAFIQWQFSKNYTLLVFNMTQEQQQEQQKISSHQDIATNHIYSAGLRSVWNM